MRKFLLFIFALAALGAGTVIFALYAPNTYPEDRFVTVSRGEKFPLVIDSLHSRGVIANKFLFRIAAKILGNTDKVQIGRYRFKSGMSNQQIMEDLWSGSTVEWISVTIPEGFTATQAAAKFAKYLGIDQTHFLSFVADSLYSRSLGARTPTLEGFLMPSTYRFFWQTDEEGIVKTMVGGFWKIWNDSLRRQAEKQKMSLTQVLTLASIVEGETHIDEERPLVAGVYLNRLSRRMFLDADPTIQYILKGGRRLLKFTDLKLDSPYNTYRHLGLPPGPVCNPGVKSILAALHPAKHKYLYFVANGKGGHVFSRTFQEHLRAAAAYRKFRDLQHTLGQSQPPVKIN